MGRYCWTYYLLISDYVKFTIDFIRRNIDSIGDGSMFVVRPRKGVSSYSNGNNFARMKSRNRNPVVDEDYLPAAAECCPSAIVMIDPAGTILLVNREAERLFQYRRDELIGKQVALLIPPNYRAEFPSALKAFCERPRSLPLGKGGDFSALRKDGSELPVEIGLNHARLNDGKTAIVVAVADLSDRKRSDNNKDEFVAMVSHELRTPMTSIAASLGLLVADSTGKMSDAAKRLLTIAHGNSKRLVRLINDILDVEKIESGKVEFDIKSFDIRPLVEQAIEANRGFADQFDVNVRLDPASPAAIVHADIDRVTQVIINLLSNAVKYSPRGGEVTVLIENRDGKTRVGVRDHGPGIPPEFGLRIFQRFAQADSADVREKGGTGLGLSIVKQIVMRLGGKVGFDPAPGGGTIFHFDLPRAEAVTGHSANRLIKDVA
jgi:PAS domain S-box-containing protein